MDLIRFLQFPQWKWAKAYYEEFRKIIKSDPTKNLKIATIYSYAANEEEADGDGNPR